jgi:hypothetical protein
LSCYQARHGGHQGATGLRDVVVTGC